MFIDKAQTVWETVASLYANAETAVRIPREALVCVRRPRSPNTAALL